MHQTLKPREKLRKVREHCARDQSIRRYKMHQIRKQPIQRCKMYPTLNSAKFKSTAHEIKALNVLKCIK